MRIETFVRACYAPLGVGALVTLCAVLFPVPSAVAPVQAGATGGLVTLYAQDDLACAFSLDAGVPGASVVEGEVRLDRAHLVFDVFAEDMLTFGFIEEVLVGVVDLGRVTVAPHSRAQDPAPEFAISLFHTLYLDGRKFSYVGAGGTLQRHTDAERIFDPLPRRGMYHVAPVVGNTYLVRVNDGGGASSADRLAKFVVVDFQPGHTVTLRWAPVPTR